MGAIKDAVAEWIRAEALFRLGPRPVCYTAASQEALRIAEENLRQVMTGAADLYAAGKVIGVVGLLDDSVSTPTGRKINTTPTVQNIPVAISTPRVVLAPPGRVVQKRNSLW